MIRASPKRSLVGAAARTATVPGLAGRQAETGPRFEAEYNVDVEDVEDINGGALDVICQVGMRFAVPGKHPIRAVFTPRAGDHWLHHGRTPFDPDRQNHLYLPPPEGVEAGAMMGEMEIKTEREIIESGNGFGKSSSLSLVDRLRGGSRDSARPVDTLIGVSLDVTATGYPLRDHQGLLSPYNYQPVYTDVKIHVWSNSFDASFSDLCNCDTSSSSLLQEHQNRIKIGTWPLSPVPEPPSKQPLFIYSLLWSAPHWVDYGSTVEVMVIC